MANKETEEDLYESSDTNIKYEATEVKSYGKRNKRNNSKRISGLWDIPHDGFTIHKRTINDKFANVLEWILAFCKKGIDFLRVFIYNVYCNTKHHERINTVKKSDNTKSKENSNDNKSKGSSFNWGSLWRGIIGLGLFLSVASMVLSAAIIYKGTDDLTSKVIIAPMAVYAFIILVKVFTSFTYKGDK